MGLSLLFAAGLLSDTDLGHMLQLMTMMVAWLSVALGLIRVAACITTRRSPAPSIGERALPTYTLLLPLFRESHMLEGLIASLSALDYPMDKLDIILICETCDLSTIARAHELAHPPFRVLIVPPTEPGGEPQTKPRALNYALARSSGELVTIFDAEDRPHPQQLREAASAFAAHPDWVALQAPLLYFNTGDSRLAAQFGLEYAGLFTVLLPFYDRLGLPFPLGGTSNHMRGLM
ncbi:MAG: glycosyltransferase [Pseudomonadota bacterium]